MYQLFILDIKNTIKLIPRMKLYGRRSLNPGCCLLFLIFLILILILIFIDFIFHKYTVYTKFIQTYPFSTVPFWKDERILNKKPLLPILKIEDINLLNSTIAIAACCRNVKKHIKGFRKNINLITSLFGNYRIYLGESDSYDGTLHFLKQWQINDSDHVTIHTKGKLSWTISSRTARIASCRNTLLEQIRNELSSFDYYFVIDVDVGSSPSFDVKDFLTNFIYPSSSWIAMTATQRSEYYDIWALRLDSIMPFDCWELIEGLTSYFIDRSFLTDHLVKIHQEPIPRNTSLIEVQSAFGGAALYNVKYLNKKCVYNGTFMNNWLNNIEQCEHVPFHQCLKEHAKQQNIYINPQFQIC